ncbi:MAG: 2'-5' RNA ligase family protein [Alphaproteobacteria bacterium]|nr:2'-5' RNA ligase family protein [Alphaproteobacteria bacterium]
MPTGQTALVVPVPAADPLVGPWRDRFDKHAAMGVPAHITVLSPWVDADAVDAALPALRALLPAGRPRFTLRRTAAWDGLCVLEPDPADWFHAVGGAVMARWGLLPYGGRYGEALQPHLTVAYGDPDPDVQSRRFAAIAADLDPRLPLAVEGAVLWVLQNDGERWAPREVLPL